MQEQHTIFMKYKSEWLHKVTGYSKNYILRVASGNVPLSRAFIERASFALKEPIDQLFILDGIELADGDFPQRN